MRVILAYAVTPRCVIDMPLCAQILSVGMQGRDVVVFALVDPEKPTTPRRFAGFGIGHELPPHDYLAEKFIGSVTTHEGLTFHIFEVHVA